MNGSGLEGFRVQGLKGLGSRIRRVYVSGVCVRFKDRVPQNRHLILGPLRAVGRFLVVHVQSSCSGGGDLLIEILGPFGRND